MSNQQCRYDQLEKATNGEVRSVCKCGWTSAWSYESLLPLVDYTTHKYGKPFRDLEATA